MNDPTVPAFDRRLAIDRLDGNESLFHEFIGFFLEDAPGLLDQIREGIEHHSLADVENAAHRLKSLTGQCGAGPAQVLATKLEQHAHEGQFTEAVELIASLTEVLGELRTSLLQELR